MIESISVSKHFKACEFLPPAQHKIVMAKKTDAERLATFYTYVEKALVEYAEKVRVYFGVSMTINNWNSGGSYTLRGFRPENTSVGAKNSMHKGNPKKNIRCKAIDYDIKGMTAKEVRQIIKDDQKLFYSFGLRRVESGVSWNHNDLKETPTRDVIVFFNP